MWALNEILTYFSILYYNYNSINISKVIIYKQILLIECIVYLFYLLSTHTIYSYATDTPIHAKNIDEQKIGEHYFCEECSGEEHDAKIFPDPINFN